MIVVKPWKPTELHWQFPYATPNKTIPKTVKWIWFIFVNSYQLESSSITFKKVLDLICLGRLCSLSISYSTCHVRTACGSVTQCKSADHANYVQTEYFSFLHLFAPSLIYSYLLDLGTEQCLTYLKVCYLWQTELQEVSKGSFSYNYFYASIE